MKRATNSENFAARSRWAGRGVRVLLITLVFATLAACSQDRALAVREMNLGIEALEGGRTMDAVRQFKEASKHDPSYAEPLYFLGQVYHLKVKDYDNAERYYREVLELSPENPQYLYRLGAVLAEQGKHEQAIAELRKSVQHKEDYARAWFRLGLSQEEAGKYPDAVDSLMKSIHANPRLRMDRDDRGGEHYHALGDLYVRFGLYDNALKVYENGIQNNADVARLYHGRGVAQLNLKRYADAAASFEKTLQLQADHPTGVFNLAVAHQALGQDSQAISVLEKFLASGSKDADQARLLAAQGMLQQLLVKSK